MRALTRAMSYHPECPECRRKYVQRLTALRELAQTLGLTPDQLAAIEAETEVLEDLI